jgi:hypothetical protein
LNFGTSISGGEKIAFSWFFFLLIDVEDEIVFQKEIPLTIFPQRTEMHMRGGFGGSNSCIWACFFFMNRYLSQERIAKEFAKNLYQFSLVDGGLGVVADAGNIFLNF